VAHALGLNSDLMESLALVHDIGHPPFGHAGERKLDVLMRPHGGRFDHNLHALRIVEQFEHRYPGFAGLNLTFEVREGIVKHSRDYRAADFPELAEYRLDVRPPLESQLIDWVDEIAYNTSDLDDALEANLLDVNLLREEAPFFGRIYANVTMQYPWAPAKLQFSEALRHMLDSLVTDVIQHTEQQVRASGVQTAEEVRLASARLAGLSENGRAQNAMLKTFLFRHVYNLPVITEDSDRSVRCLEELFIYYLQKPHSMPETHEEMARETPRHVVVCDYIAGMTDQFLLRQHQEQFGSPASSVSSIARPQRIE
jgi:dGTPase